jgi:flavodoxin
MTHDTTDGFDPSRRTFLRCAALGLIAGAALPGALPAHASGPAQRGRKILTAFYSHTGNTRTVAGHLRDLAGGDFARIEPANPYPADYGATSRRVKEERASGVRTPLTTKVDHLDAYDVICIGSPCWFDSIAVPVASFLSGYDFSGKVVALFMTHGGSGLGEAMTDVPKLCPGAKIAQGLAIRGDAVNAAASREDVARWLRGLGMV